MLKIYYIFLNVISLSLKVFSYNHYLVIDNVIYYTVDDRFADSEKDAIKSSIRQVTTRSCLEPKIHNIHYEDKPAWIEFVRTDDDECKCDQRPENATTISLSPRCFQDGFVVREILHALGFQNEVKRRDRNCYVEVNSEKWDDPDYSIDTDIDIRIPYDIFSAMHFKRGSFLRPAKDYYDQNAEFGSDNLMSRLDVWILNHEFCGEPHYCDSNQRECDEIAADLQERACVVKPQ